MSPIPAIDIPFKKAGPWSYYNDSKDLTSHTISSKDIVKRILEISWDRYDVAVFFAVLYLTASRLKEILPYKYKGSYRQQAKELGYILTKPGFILKQITMYKDENGELFWCFKTINLKQNSKLGDDKIDIHARLKLIDKTNYKEINIPLCEDFPDYKIIKLLDEFFDAHNFYVDNLQDVIDNMPNNSYAKMFKDVAEDFNPFKKITYKIAIKLAHKYFDMSIHSFREIRMQILRREYFFDVSDLSVIGGWSKNSTMALRYSRSSQKEIIHKFRAKALEEMKLRDEIQLKQT